MTDVICLSPSYSTTRCVTRKAPGLRKLPSNKFEPLLFLPSTNSRRVEGGNRTKGYFKKADLAGQSVFLEKAEVHLPLITVITVVFNAEKTLEKAILSVINQSYSNIEFIVIDGGSTDNSIDIIKKYQYAIDYWVSESDTGIYDAWNKGVRLASGDWIAFLGADDAYTDGAIEAYASFISNCSDVKLEYVSSRVNLVNHTTKLRVVGAPWRWAVFRKYMNVAHVGSLHRWTLFEEYGLFDDSYRISGDYEFLLRAGSTLNAHFLDFVTVDMQVGGVSDANIQVFNETTRAKKTTGQRSIFMCQLEKYYAIFKWKLRSQLRN
ncbi:glycosyltransferase family 2 protein [Herminiimonas arsenitoxidans]|uniref:glycosyltransferase family 2 protein n=1 Tax=Herminiimonas arsenitoxidans TaxID=1809410 RepID=UPI0009F95192|nr:glycosyltransferase family 2 protein [Herminiimonas arsenitoxidans]